MSFIIMLGTSDLSWRLILSGLGSRTSSASISMSMSQLMALLGSWGDGVCNMLSSKYSKLLLAGLVCPLLLLLLLIPLSRMSMLPLSTFGWRRCACELCESKGMGVEVHAEVGGVPRPSDVEWVHRQVQPLKRVVAGGGGAWVAPRKGINPRTRQQQLVDLRRFHGISHYENGSRSGVECTGELLVEHHHSYYGEPWAGGRDVFEFLATAMSLQPRHRVLEIGCGTLRVGLHFIRFLHASNFFCLERDALSLAAALLYELPANGLLNKRPLLLLGDDLQYASELLHGPPFDLVYASAVFLHMPDATVWKTVSVLAKRLADPHGRLFVSHNIKFCTRLSWTKCESRLRKSGLQYVGKQTHDSLLFNHFEVWYEFKRHMGH